MEAILTNYYQKNNFKQILTRKIIESNIYKLFLEKSFQTILKKSFQIVLREIILNNTHLRKCFKQYFQSTNYERNHLIQETYQRNHFKHYLQNFITEIISSNSFREIISNTRKNIPNNP